MSFYVIYHEFNFVKNPENGQGIKDSNVRPNENSAFTAVQIIEKLFFFNGIDFHNLKVITLHRLTPQLWHKRFENTYVCIPNTYVYNQSDYKKHKKNELK